MIKSNIYDLTKTELEKIGALLLLSITRFNSKKNKKEDNGEMPW